MWFREARSGLWFLSCFTLLQEWAAKELQVLSGSVSGSEIHFDDASGREPKMEASRCMMSRVCQEDGLIDRSTEKRVSLREYESRDWQIRQTIGSVEELSHSKY